MNTQSYIFENKEKFSDGVYLELMNKLKLDFDAMPKTPTPRPTPTPPPTSSTTNFFSNPPIVTRSPSLTTTRTPNQIRIQTSSRTIVINVNNVSQDDFQGNFINVMTADDYMSDADFNLNYPQR